MATTIFLVRHAQADNPENIEYGRIPGYRLSVKGKEQAKQIGKYLADKGIKHIYTSPLERAFETANLISEQIPEATITHMFELNEVESSAWQGTKIEDLFKNDAYENFINEPDATLPTENLHKLADRMGEVVTVLVARHTGEAIACISHEFPILALKLRLEDKPLQSLKTYNFTAGSILVLHFDEQQKFKNSETVSLS